jgi:glucan 1,3-beta-glucosidase
VVNSLTSGGKYYERSKPQYENVPASSFISARKFGAKGDGTADDTFALNQLFAHVANKDLIAFVDAGTYIVTGTVHIPPNVKLVGEGLASIIMGTGAFFGDIENPKPVIKVGSSCKTGYIEWSDMIVSTRGPCPGAKLIEYRLSSPGTPSGMWDVHTRVGGFAGTNLQLAQCPTSSGSNAVNPNCIAAWMGMHITKSASNLYMENNWLWVADHDLEDNAYTQITVFAGRGLLIESTNGKIWLSSTGVEHHTLYQYQLVGTKEIYMAMPQTETPYYQPSPPANLPFPAKAAYNDPDFVADCKDVTLPGVCAMAWGMRIIGSKDIVMYGVGLYSFFNSYSNNCAQTQTPVKCQARIFEVRNGSGGVASQGVQAYDLNTIGSTSMVTRYGTDVALFSDNVAGFASTIVVYKN